MQEIRPHGMAPLPVGSPRLHDAAHPMVRLPAGYRAQPKAGYRARSESDRAPTATGLFGWQVLAILAAMGGLSTLAWKLHRATSETTRLESHVTNLGMLVRSALDDHAHTRMRLAESTADKRLLHRFLTEAGLAEKALRQNLGEVRADHDEAVLINRQQAQAWSAQGTAMKLSLDAETTKREEAQQLASHYETESQRLASEASNLEQSLIGTQRENAAMYHEICRLRSYVRSVESENSSLRSDKGCLESKVRSLESEVRSLRCH